MKKKRMRRRIAELEAALQGATAFYDYGALKRAKLAGWNSLQQLRERGIIR
jgi:hypothetical protein